MEPGKFIFSYQYESRITERVFGNRGYKITYQVYKGGTIFYYQASSKISVHHQVSFTEEDTNMSKLNFKREATSAGVPVDIYFRDNGIYTSREFTRDLHDKDQGIRHIGLGHHHHNGVAYNSIKNVVRIARTMVIHAALRWPDTSENIIWSMDMAHAINLHNHTPHISSGMYPEEVWTSSNYSHSALQNSHTWECLLVK